MLAVQVFMAMESKISLLYDDIEGTLILNQRIYGNEVKIMEQKLEHYPTF